MQTDSRKNISIIAIIASPFVFIGIVAVSAALLLSVFSEYTKETVKVNKELDKKKNILLARYFEEAKDVLIKACTWNTSYGIQNKEGKAAGCVLDYFFDDYQGTYEDNFQGVRTREFFKLKLIKCSWNSVIRRNKLNQLNNYYFHSNLIDF